MGEYWPDALHGPQDSVPGLEIGIGVDERGNALVEELDVGLERFGSAGVQSAQQAVLAPSRLVAGGGELLEELGASGDQLGQSFEVLAAHHRSGRQCRYE